VPVTTKTFALPAALILTFPSTTGILTLLFPFAKIPVIFPTVARFATVNPGVDKMPVTLSNEKPKLAPNDPASLN